MDVKTTSARARDAASSAAASGSSDALARARNVGEAWYRCQALASVAWHADDGWEAIAREAVAAADECAQAYGRAAVRAWPLRVLLERGGERMAAPVFDRAMREAAAVEHPVSRLDALALLLDAVMPHSPTLRNRAAEALAEAVSQARSWKGAWKLRRAALQAGQWDRALALRLAAAIPEGRDRRRAEWGIAAAEWEPGRWFFAPR